MKLRPRLLSYVQSPSGCDCGAGDRYVGDRCAHANICENWRTSALRALVAHDHAGLPQRTKTGARGVAYSENAFG